jgi:hypothetical protein
MTCKKLSKNDLKTFAKAENCSTFAPEIKPYRLFTEKVIITIKVNKSIVLKFF